MSPHGNNLWNFGIENDKMMSENRRLRAPLPYPLRTRTKHLDVGLVLNSHLEMNQISYNYKKFAHNRIIHAQIHLKLVFSRIIFCKFRPRVPWIATAFPLLALQTLTPHQLLADLSKIAPITGTRDEMNQSCSDIYVSWSFMYRVAWKITLPFNRVYLTNYASYRNVKASKLKFIQFSFHRCYFYDHASHRYGQNGHPKKINAKRNFKSDLIGYFLWTVGHAKVKKCRMKAHLSLFRIMYSFMLAIQESSKWHSEKNCPCPKKLSEPVMNCASGDVFWVDYIRKAISTVFRTRVSMKPMHHSKENWMSFQLVIF